MDWLRSQILIQDEALYFGSDPASIMSKDEDLIMERSAQVLCKNKGSILNVGFGMGIIDSYIKSYSPKKHTIIEIHPKVYEMALEMGFKENIILGDWEDVVQEFITDKVTFDSIYFDTISFTYENDQWGKFNKVVDKLLNPGGIYCFFNQYGSVRGKVEEYMDKLDYKKYIKVIPYKEIVENISRDNPKVSKKDYRLVYYIKNNLS